MVQVISIIDTYAYIPLMRHVFSQRVFRPRMGQLSDEGVIQDGLDASRPVLADIEDLVSEDRASGNQPNLADFHLAAMIDYFIMAPEGACHFARYPKLTAWWSRLQHRASITATNPLAQRDVKSIP